MTGVQEPTLQLTWRSCAGFETVIGQMQVERLQWIRKEESWHARLHAWEE